MSPLYLNSSAKIPDRNYVRSTHTHHTSPVLFKEPRFPPSGVYNCAAPLRQVAQHSAFLRRSGLHARASEQRSKQTTEGFGT